MSKETLLPQNELEQLANGLGKTFIQRWDLYPRQMDDGSYVCIHKPLQARHLLAHLQGKITLGAYVLDQASQARSIVLDADTDEQMEGLIHMAAGLAEQGVSAYLEDSCRGGHLWLFFAEPLAARDARRFGRSLLERYSLSGVELFGPGQRAIQPVGQHGHLGFGHLVVDDVLGKDLFLFPGETIGHGWLFSEERRVSSWSVVLCTTCLLSGKGAYL